VDVFLCKEGQLQQHTNGSGDSVQCMGIVVEQAGVRWSVQKEMMGF
jgi:hypothetical protein